MNKRKIFFRGSRTHTEMTIEEAKQLGRPFYFCDPEAGLCAPTEDGHEPVAGHKVKDYSKNNPLTPRKNPKVPDDNTEDFSRVKRREEKPFVFTEDDVTAEDNPYLKNNPLTPRKDETGVKKSLLAP